MAPRLKVQVLVGALLVVPLEWFLLSLLLVGEGEEEEGVHLRERERERERERYYQQTFFTQR